MERAKSDGTSAPRLLIGSDCTAVLLAIEKGWRGGSGWRLGNQHRQVLLERILLRRAEWERRGGAVVFLWTPAHRGVYPNQYADTIAKAHVDRPTAPQYTMPIGRRGSMVQYETQQPDGSYSWMAGDRRLLGLVQRAIGRYAVRRSAAEASHDLTERPHRRHAE